MTGYEWAFGDGVTSVITYTYGPLEWLTGAYYSTGEGFEYAYGAVGNRTVMTAATSVMTCTYPSATLRTGRWRNLAERLVACYNSL